MEKKLNRINANQLCAIIITVFIAMRPIIRISIQTGISQNDAWITCLTTITVNLCYAIILAYIAYTNPNKSFYEIVKSCLGTFVSKIIMIFMAIYFFFKLVIINFETESFLYETLYSEINWEMFLIPIVLIYMFFAIKGIRPIARTLQFFLPFSVLALICSLLLSSKSWNFSNLLPIFNYSYNKYLMSCFYSIIQSGEFLFVAIIMENILTNEKKYFLKLTASTSVVLVLVVGFYIIYISVFGNLSQFIKEGLVQITQFSPTSNAMLKSDAFISMMWLPIIVLEASLCLYGLSWCLNKIFNLKMPIGIVISSIVVFSLDLIPQISTTFLEKFYYDKLGPFMFTFEIFMPIVVMIANSIKLEKEKMHEKNN